MSDLIAEPFLYPDEPFPVDHGVPETIGNITYYRNLVQGSDEWLKIRLGLLTASEMKLILTPTLKIANNEKTRTHLYELMAQRITGYVEPHYISDDMLRGHEDEVDARIVYAQNIAPVQDIGFLTNNKLGFTIGYSPDGLVGDTGLIETKSRRQKYQVQTVLDHIVDGEGATIPAEFLLQCQTGLLVSEREWLDFISYSGGLPMVVIRVYPDEQVQDAIINAATEFEASISDKMADYQLALKSGARMFPTKRKIYEEINL